MEAKEGLATEKDLERVERTLDGKIDRVEKTLSGKVEDNSRKIEENSKKIDRVAIQVINNSEAINKMVTRDEFNEFRNEVLSGQDKMMTILTRLDQERIFAAEWMRRIEGDVERLKGDREAKGRLVPWQRCGCLRFDDCREKLWQG